MTFDEAFNRLISQEREGGYVNDSNDPGGETKFGISKRSYPQVDIKALTRDQAKAIYLRDFWQQGKMDILPPALSFQVFDFAVNSGIETALRYLQRCAGVAEDGHIGPVTLNAVKRVGEPDILFLFIAERLDFWTRLSTWPTFGRGWARRAAHNLRDAARDTIEGGSPN